MALEEASRSLSARDSRSVDVCFLSSMHPAFDKRVFDKEAISLKQAGFSVVHLCPAEHAERKVIDGITIQTYARREGLRGRLAQMRLLYRLAARENARTYHCNEVDSWFVGALLALMRRATCVFDVHEHYPSTFAESRFPRWLQPAVGATIRLLFRILTPFTARLVLAKRSVAEDFRFAQEKLVLVQNFTPLQGVRVSSQRRSHSPDEALELVHLGLISKIRGWPQLLAGIAGARQKRVALKVIGKFHDRTDEEFLAEASRLGIADQVTVLEWMPFDRAFEHLCAADVGVVAFQPGIKNHEYALPHKMFDYMAAGTAVLCPSFAVEIAPIIVECQCGLLIDSSSPEDITKKILQLANDRSETIAMGERGRRAIIERYNWEAEATKLCQMYSHLMEVHGGAA